MVAAIRVVVSFNDQITSIFVIYRSNIAGMD